MNDPTRMENGTRRLPPWLASALLKRGDLAPRFVYWRQRLARQSRGWRRRLRRQLAVGVTGAALLLAVAGARAQIDPAAPDNTITVVNGQVNVVANGQCSLMEAIQNANNKTNGRPYTDCVAGNPNGADVINLPANGVFTLNSAFVPDAAVGPIGLPWISSTITLNGNGSTIQRGNNAPDFRVMAVGNQGNLSLNNVTVRNGYIYSYGYDTDCAFEGGAGILNQGSLTITGSTISDNSADANSYGCGIAGGGIFNTGWLVLSESTIKNNDTQLYGGGIYTSETANLTILNSSISGNTTFYTYGSGGAGVKAFGNLTIVDSVFQSNEAHTFFSSGWGSADSVLSSGVDWTVLLRHINESN